MSVATMIVSPRIYKLFITDKISHNVPLKGYICENDKNKTNRLVSADKTSGAEHLCTFGTLNSNLADLLAEDYAKNGFKNDPMVQTALLSPKVRVRHLPGSQYSSSYRSQYFAEFRDLERLAPIIGRFVLRHVRLAREKHVLDSAYEQRITRLVEDNTQIFSRLSPRERQVCKQILLGRRLYGKLNIRSKTELFQLALMALT